MKDPEPRPYHSSHASRMDRCIRRLTRFVSPTVLGLMPLTALAQDALLESTPLAPAATSNAGWYVSVVIAATLLLAFISTLAESVLQQISPAFVRQLETTQPRQARRLQNLCGPQLHRSRMALLSLNTGALIVGATVAGSQAMQLTDHWGLSLTALTLSVMFFGVAGILPRTLGAVHWQRLAVPSAHFLSVCNQVLLPILMAAEWFSQWIARGRDVKVFNRDEFLAMAHMGTQSGQIQERESRMIRSLFRFGSLRASDVMTPRTVVAALPESMPIEHALQFRMTAPFSRIPVFNDDLDTVTGFVLREDMLLAQTRGTGHRAIAELRRDIVAVAASTPLSQLLDLFVHRRQQIAIVVGEFGETKGLVTMEDVIETLLGIEILDEGDKIEDMQALARKLWRKRAESLGLDHPVAHRHTDKAAISTQQPTVRQRNKRLVLANSQS